MSLSGQHLPMFCNLQALVTFGSSVDNVHGDHAHSHNTNIDVLNMTGRNSILVHRKC